MKTRRRTLLLVALVLAGTVLAVAPATSQVPTTATLIVEAIPEGPTAFVFTYDGDFPTPLVDDGTAANTAFNGSAPLGTHTWAQTVPPGWTSLGASCVNNTTGTVLTFPGPSATITWNAGDQWVCTFTNATDPNEPNDSVGAATPAACGFSSAGAAIAPPGDLDFYGPFTPDPAHLYPATLMRIDIDAQINGSTLDSIVGVFDAGGALLESQDDAPAPGEPFTFDSYLEFVAPSPGTFYIGVTSFADFDFDGIGAFSTGTYTLTVSCIPLQPPAASVGSFPDEPNDTPDTATPAACPGVIMSQISPVGDLDFFDVTAPPGARVAVDVDAAILGSPLDPLIAAWDGTDRLALNDDAPAPGEPFTLDSFLEFTAPASGQFTLGMTSFADFDFDAGPDAFSLGFYTINLDCQLPAGLVVEKFTNGADADQGPGPSIAVGDEVRWVYLVTNTAQAPLKDVVVWDGRLPDIPIEGPVSGDDGNGTLDPGEVWRYEATGVAEPGHYANYGAAGATAPDGTRLRHQDWSHYFGVLPRIGIAIEGLVDGAPSPTVLVPTDVEFSYRVSNTGLLPLGGVRVTDGRAGSLTGPESGDANGDGLLDPNETWVYTRSAPARLGAQTGGATARGEDEHGRIVTDETTTEYLGAFVDMAVRVRGDYWASPGGPVSLTYMVTNTGTAGADAVVVDSLCDPVVLVGGDDGNGLVDRGETWTFECAGTAGPYGRDYHEIGVIPLIGGNPVPDRTLRNNQAIWTVFVQLR